MTEHKLTLAEVRDFLTEEKERRPESFNSVQNSALIHAQAYKLSAEDAKAIVEEASALEPITETAAYKIADLLPQFPSEVRAIFQKERIPADEDLIKQVLEIVAKYQ